MNSAYLLKDRLNFFYNATYFAYLGWWYNECMKIEISCANVDLTPPFREYILEKMETSHDAIRRFEEGGELSLFFKIARTTKHLHGDVFDAEAMLQLPGKLIHVKSTNSDARAAVDEIKDELKIELRKYKEKSVSKTTRNRKTSL